MSAQIETRVTLTEAELRTDTTEQTFNIPAVNFPSFEANMKKLTKRASKLSSATVGFEVLRRYVVKTTRINEWTGARFTVETTMVEVRVFGPRPRFEGWALVGRMDFKAAAPGVLRMMVPGETWPPEFHDIESGRCDHCGFARKRNDSFIVRHDDGTVKIVGRQCIADFLGHQSPAHLALMAEIMSSVTAAGEDSERFYGSRLDVTDPTEILVYASYCVRNFGWTSSKESNSTRESVFGMMTPCRESTLDEHARQAACQEAWERDSEKAAAVLLWVAELDARSSDYLSNLQTVLANGVTYKTMGIAVSAVVAYDRAMEREVERRNAAKTPSTSTHVGRVGDRLDFDAEVVRVRYTEGAYGTTTIITLRDDAGNVYTWFASGGKDVETGARVTVRGTVKKHDNFKDTAQTVITRCKLTPISCAALARVIEEVAS